MSDRLSFLVADGLDHVVVSVTGEIDGGTEREFRDGLVSVLSQGALRLVVDLAAVPFMASAGVAVLMGLHRALTVRGGSVVLAAPRPVVARVLSLTGADEVISVYPDVGDAVTGFGLDDEGLPSSSGVG